MSFDLVVAGGKVVTATDVFDADIGVRDGRIVAIAEKIDGGDRRIDATGRLVLPGGIEAHCHIAQESAAGLMNADDYRTGSISAAFGGNSCFIPFAAQAKGETPLQTLVRYDARATGASVIDWSYHLIVSDPTDAAIRPGLLAWWRFNDDSNPAEAIDSRAGITATFKDSASIAAAVIWPSPSALGGVSTRSGIRCSPLSLRSASA